MTRQEIIDRVQLNIDFFRARFNEFCGKVETYGREFSECAAAAEEKWIRKNDEVQPKVRKAITRAQAELGPAYDAMCRAQEDLDHAIAKYNEEAKRIVAQADKRIERLREDRPADFLCIEPPESIRKIQEKLHRDLGRAAAKPEACRRASLAAIERYEAIKDRTSPAYYGDRRHITNPPDPGTVWTTRLDRSTWWCLKLKPFCPFCKPVNLTNPAWWFCVPSDELGPEEEERVMRAIVELGAVHDLSFRDKDGKDKPDVKLVYRRGDYPQERLFQADTFWNAQAERLADPKRDAEIIEAWRAVEGLLPAELSETPGKWKPPAGYLDAKQIKADCGVPGPTLQGWRKRDDTPGGPLHRKLVTAPGSAHTLYYPEDWVKKQVENWQPKKNHKRRASRL